MSTDTAPSTVPAADDGEVEVVLPRLLYHRYFMLADQAELPFDDKPTRDYWGRKYLEAYGRQLLAINENAQSVRLLRYNHWPPPRRYFVDKDGKRCSSTSRSAVAILRRHRQPIKACIGNKAAPPRRLAAGRRGPRDDHRDSRLFQ